MRLACVGRRDKEEDPAKEIRLDKFSVGAKGDAKGKPRDKQEGSNCERHGQCKKQNWHRG